MNSNRERMLDRIRQSVTAGNRAGVVPSPEPRGAIGYQGAGIDPVAQFGKEFQATGGHFHAVADAAGAVARILSVLRAKDARPVLLTRGPVVDALGLDEPLRAGGHEPIWLDTVSAAAAQATFFSGAASITGVDCLVAETGSVVLESRPEQPRAASLLPPLHIAIAERRQLVPDLFDLFEAAMADRALPACVSIITGPSKTGDIELRLVTGVHGPGEVHVVLLTGEAQA